MEHGSWSFPLSSTRLTDPDLISLSRGRRLLIAAEGEDAYVLRWWRCNRSFGQVDVTDGTRARCEH